MSTPLALICSVSLEADPLRRRLERPVPERIGRKPATRGLLAGVQVVLLEGGMGKVAAAQALTALLEREDVGGVIGFGVGGAYPGSGLAVGDLAVATEEVYGDEGVATPGGWISTEEIGIPLAQRDGSVYYNRFPTDPRAVESAVASARGEGIRAFTGRFVTVSCCSGTAALGAELEARFGATCETMEGGAYAQVSAIYGMPFLEIRGISNQVEDRDLSRWRLADAAEAAARAVETIVRRHADRPIFTDR